MHRNGLAVATALLLVLGTASAAFSQYSPSYGTQSAGTVKQALATAIAHAKYAAASDAKSGATGHLWHTVNCIEGATGKNYNGGAGNPCQGQGEGIVNDLRSTQGGGAFLLVAAAADNLALAGLKAGDLAEVRNAARGVAALLQTIADGLK